MSSLTRPQLDASLKAGRVAPLYLLVGCETYLRDAAAQAITDVALAGTLLREFNESSFSLLSESASAAIAVAEQLPMMAARRVVRLKDFTKLSDADEEALMFPVKAFGAEIVMGSRFSGPKYTRVQYFSHKVGNRFITLIFNILFNTTFTDIYTCYLLYRRDLVPPDELVSFGWEQHGEILCRAVRRAKVIYEVPVSYHGRSYDEGKKIRARHVIPVIGMIFRRRLFG